MAFTLPGDTEENFQIKKRRKRKTFAKQACHSGCLSSAVDATAPGQGSLSKSASINLSRVEKFVVKQFELLREL